MVLEIFCLHDLLLVLYPRLLGGEKEGIFPWSNTWILKGTPFWNYPTKCWVAPWHFYAYESLSFVLIWLPSPTALSHAPFIPLWPVPNIPPSAFMSKACFQTHTHTCLKISSLLSWSAFLSSSWIGIWNIFLDPRQRAHLVSNIVFKFSGGVTKEYRRPPDSCGEWAEGLAVLAALFSPWQWE